MKNELMKKGFKIFMVVGFILTVIGVRQSYAQLINRGYEFGPGTNNLVSSTQRLNVPARSTVTVAVSLQRTFAETNGVAVADVPVAIEVFRPGTNTPAAIQFANATVVNAAVQIPIVTFPGIFTSQKGCPDTWRVRIRTNNNAPAAVRVFGSVAFVFVRPGATNIDMEGSETFSLDGSNGSDDKTRVLAGQNLIGGLDRSVIAGTGVFRIRAKWDTAWHWSNVGKFYKLRVRLRKPNGVQANSERGFSQHADDSNLMPEVDFRYTVLPGDAQMSGTWKLEVVSSNGTPKIENFDIENLILPSFSSTFTPQCTGNP